MYEVQFGYRQKVARRCDTPETPVAILPMRPALLVLCFVAISSLTALATDAPLTSLPATDRLPGVDLTEGISQITGVAISPLLGVSSVGAWRYYRTPEAQRHLLPWFCHPYVFGFGFLILGLCFLKDLFGTAAPPLIKKPFDMAELFENKLSGLVASAAFVPFIASQMAQNFSSGQQTHLPTSPNLYLASVLPIHFAASGFDFRLFFIPLAILAFLTVWLASHTINVLIALCPFGFIDALLKLMKMALLSSVVLSYLINPYFGAAVSLIILFVAALIAPWAFRLTVFGTLLAADIIAPSRARRGARPTRAHAFLARPISGTPARTYGHLIRADDGTLYFTYRPWLIFPRRAITMPTGANAISKGIFFPSFLHSSGDPEPYRLLVMFLPRYRTHEAAIATHLYISDVRDSSLKKGFKAIRQWFTDTLSLGKAKYDELRRT